MNTKRSLRFFNTTSLGEGITPAYLIIFDRRPESVSKSWDERITWETDGDVNVLGC